MHLLPVHYYVCKTLEIALKVLVKPGSRWTSVIGIEDILISPTSKKFDDPVVQLMFHALLLQVLASTYG